MRRRNGNVVVREPPPMRHEWKPMSPRAFMFWIGVSIITVVVAIAVALVLALKLPLG
jgi:hypothetical protein